MFFERPAIMNLPSWDDGRDILNQYAKMTKLLESEMYTASIKEQILDAACSAGRRASRSRWRRGAAATGSAGSSW